MSTAIQETPDRPRAFAVWFKDLRLWSVGSFFCAEWKWPRECVRPLSATLCRRVEKVDRTRYSLDDLQLVTLHFDGSLEPRSRDAQFTFKGRLFFAFAGDVVYSRIDVRNGAIGVIPPEMRTVAVSSEYPVYTVAPEVALPAYVKLLFRTEYFRRAINSMISGASGRKRVQPVQIEGLEVPLPSLAIQDQIVARWEDAQKAIAEVRKRVNRLKKEIDARFFRDLGLTPPEEVARAQCFGVWWKDFQRWSVSFNQAARTGSDLSRGTYPVVELGSVLDLVQYGTSEKANAGGSGTHILRINNIKDRGLDLTDLKHVRLAPKARDRLLLKDGDILVVRTSGSRDLVGTCGVFHERGEYVFASYLIRLRTAPTKADPDFVSWFLNSPLGRHQVDATSRQIMQNNINSMEISDLQLPLPSVTVQQAIMKRVTEGRGAIAEERQKTALLAAAVEREIEEMILGARPVPAIGRPAKTSL